MLTKQEQIKLLIEALNSVTHDYDTNHSPQFVVRIVSTFRNEDRDELKAKLKQLLLEE